MNDGVTDYPQQALADHGASAGGKPVLRLVHNMARSGSTLICKCLGCMHGVNLLSEIHPLGTHMFNPLNQAHAWFSLFNADDLQRLQTGSVSFVEAIELIEMRSRQRGETLVIRDWGHLDYTGLPFLNQPAFTLGLADALAPHFQLIQTATVRHPLDQWLSLSRLGSMQEVLAEGGLTIASFLQGYLEYARCCQETGFFRYEDFTSRPVQTMQAMCESLALPFDPGFIERWHAYTTITGDVASTRGGNEIKSLQRRQVDPALRSSFEREPAYAEALALLGYSS